MIEVRFDQQRTPGVYADDFSVVGPGGGPATKILKVSVGLPLLISILIAGLDVWLGVHVYDYRKRVRRSSRRLSGSPN